MDERIAELERLVDSLHTAMRGLEQRMVRLEGGIDTAPGCETAVSAVTVDASPRPPARLTLAALRSTPAFVGRSLLVLAGGFFLRALTEAGTLAPTTGIALGLAYAAVWVAAAAADAHRGRHSSAGFFAACAAVIGNPLLFEAVTSFGVLSGNAATVALTGMTAVGLAVAARWNMRGAAWVFGIGCMTTAVALAVARPPGEAASAVLVAFGLAWLWFDEHRCWSVLTWLAAAAADVAVLRLTELAAVPFELPQDFGTIHLWAVVGLQMVLVFGYVGAAAVRAFRRDRRIRTFDVAQSLAAWAVGWGGALRIASASGWSTTGFFAFALAVGVAAYLAAFGVADRRQGRSGAFFFLSSVGLALVLLGMPGVAGPAAAMVWAAIAVGFAAAGSRWDRATLRAHAVVLLAAAWVSGGLAAGALESLAGTGERAAAPSVPVVAIAVLTVAATCCVLAGRRHHVSGPMAQLPLTALLAMSALAIAAVFASATRTAAPATAVALGTVALAAVTVALAILASRWGTAEARWLVSPMLVVTGLKVVTQDLASGRAAVFVVALAAYGAALVAAPWLLRSGRNGSDGATVAEN